ncbi:MAG: ATP-binding protein [Deltaproteobacteria bacterium]|nr:ATP-binding protein [Deltaproteobacteria bacterium]
MIPRQIVDEFQEALKEYPVVTVFGPRQSGKTTLVRMNFPEKPYYSFEDPDTRLAVQADPRGFLQSIPDGAILDEVQRIPDLLSYLQGVVDAGNKSAKFILTGSHQPEVHQAVSQTLAGRTAILTLLPFSLDEISHYEREWNPFDLIATGMFPRIHEEKLEPSRFFNGYVQTYVERDVRALINLKDLRLFQHFLILLAGRIGQVINYASLSNDVGVSSTTVKNWISVLKASFVIFELPPFFENIGKRVVRSPKIYFTDTGLAAHLMGIETGDQASRDPLRGNLYENLIILEFFKALLNQGKRSNLHFYRDTHGNEVDLIVKMGRRLIPIEIKSAATFTPQFLKGIERFRKAAGERCDNGFVLYGGERKMTVKGVQVMNLFSQGVHGIL